MRKLVSGERPLYWVGSAKRDLLTLPAAVKDGTGTALSIAQFAGKHPAAKPWKWLGTGVLEGVENHDGKAHRAVYTLRFRSAVYVLHCFQKKSHRGHSDADSRSGTRFAARDTGYARLRGSIWED